MRVLLIGRLTTASALRIRGLASHRGTSARVSRDSSLEVRTFTAPNGRAKVLSSTSSRARRTNALSCLICG